MYEGVHNQHHAKRYYGTVNDPEYLPLALMKPWTLPVFLVAAALAPIGMLIRFGVLAPLSLLSPKLREVVVRAIRGCRSIRSSAVRSPRASSAGSGVAWRRRAACGRSRCWRWSRPASFRSRAFLIFLGVASGVMFLNQVRTLVAHLWENDGEPMTVTAQFLDSVNVPPPATLPALWAPVGLRYHALTICFRACPIMRSARRIAGCARRWTAIPSIMCRAIAACTRWSAAWPQAAGVRRALRRLFHFNQADFQPPSSVDHDRLAAWEGGSRSHSSCVAREHVTIRTVARACGRAGGTGARLERRRRTGAPPIIPAVRLNPTLRLSPSELFFGADEDGFADQQEQHERRPGGQEAAGRPRHCPSRG